MASAFICEECPRKLECLVCHVTFLFMKQGAGRLPRFCSDEHRETWAKDRPARLRAEGRSVYRNPRYRADRYAAMQPSDFVCATCGNEFPSKQNTAKYCGLKCMAAALREGHDKDRTKRIKWAAERAMKAGVEFERFDPFEIFERDGWSCYICGDPTPKELRGTRHPKAPELEHRVPISKGGSHTRDNVACACRRCNWEKGTGEPETPVFLMPDWRSVA